MEQEDKALIHRAQVISGWIEVYEKYAKHYDLNNQETQILDRIIPKHLRSTTHMGVDGQTRPAAFEMQLSFKRLKCFSCKNLLIKTEIY